MHAFAKCSSSVESASQSDPAPDNPKVVHFFLPVPGSPSAAAAYYWASGPAMLFCPPFGYEQVGLTRVWTDFAHRLSRHGIAALRLDLPGIGNSAGDVAAPDLVSHWRATIKAAAEWLSVRHAGQLLMLGCRFGALLALDALAGGVVARRLILLDPPASGTNLARKLRMRAKFEGLGAPPEGTDFLQVHGVPVSREMLTDLAALPRGLPRGVRLPPTLLVEHETSTNWKDQLVKNAASLTVAPFDGYEGFALRDSLHTIEPTSVLDRVLAFASIGSSETAADPDPRSGLVLPGLQEEPVLFGANGALTGLLCRPDWPMPGAPAVLLPTIGHLPYSGYFGTWTELARHLALKGITSLRFDMAGAGTQHLPLAVACLLPERVDDIKVAADLLTREGYSSQVVIGICAGAHAGWMAADVDPRIAGIVAINIPVLVRQPTLTAASDPVSADAIAAPAEAPRSSLFQRYQAVIKSPIPPLVLDFLRRMGSRERTARRQLRRLTARGCKIEFVFGSRPDYCFRRTFGTAPELPNGTQLTLIDGADHIFTNRHHRARLIEVVTAFTLRLSRERFQELQADLPRKLALSLAECD